MSSLTSKFHMELPFDSCYIAELWEMIGPPPKYLVFMVSDSKKSLHIVVLTLYL